MVRPKCCRKIECSPDTKYFKPKGIPSVLLEEIILNLDEFEAIRLADYEGLYHEQASLKMNISRQTFGRILESAHKKIADALLNAKAIRIEGGEVDFIEAKKSRCRNCQKILEKSDSLNCPACNGEKIKEKK